jgi:hypothetical protein
MVNRKGILAAALLIGALIFGVVQWRSSVTPVMDAGGAAAPGDRLSGIAWIQLDRLDLQNRPVLDLGNRDPFRFKPTPPPAPPPGMREDPNGAGYMPEGTPIPTDPPTPTPPTPPPPLPLKFIGMFEPKGKPKIAVLLSEQKEIMHGREGDLLGGRYRIQKIGLESVDVQDVTTSQVERLPLRGN